MKTALILSLAALTGACAPTLAQPAAGFDPAATTFTGWVRVSNGEFQLYPQQRQLREPFSRPCVSGALPRDQQRVAADLSGSQVRFTGRAVRWAENQQNDQLNFEGSRISNDCRGEYVIQATDVTVLR